MTDLTKELNRSQGIPFLEYKHFVTRTFFPKVSLCPHQPPQGLLGLSRLCSSGRHLCIWENLASAVWAP